MRVGKKLISVAVAAAFTFTLFGAGAAALLAADPVAPVASAAADNYYSSITATQGTALLGQLHDLITTTHTKYTSYSSYEQYAYQTDPGGSNRSIREFYTHEVMTTGLSGNIGDWNREHVWPKSLSNNLWQNDRGGADLHHLRPTEVSLNTTRGNHKYGKASNGKEARSDSGELGGHVSGDTFEPLDESKGDAARIVMYMYLHYNTYTSSIFGGYATTNGSGASNCFGSLTFTKVISASNEAAAIDLLLEWNELDPVDEVERTRNTVVYGVQGNRNPFIDNPEYANAIWGDGVVDAGGGSDVGGGSQGGGTQGGGTTTPTETFTPLTDPQEGTYYLMMQNNGADNYATSSLDKDGYYLTSTTDLSSAASYEIIEDGDGWLIKQGSKYLEITISGTHANPIFRTSRTANQNWKWDDEHSIFYWTNNSDQYFLGTRSDRNYTTIGGCAWIYVDEDCLAKFGTFGTTGGGSQGGSDVGGGGSQSGGDVGGNQGGGTTTPGGGTDSGNAQGGGAPSAEEETSSGCGGIIGGAGAAVLVTAIGAAAIAIRRRK